jgi:hypothetical protein
MPDTPYNRIKKITDKVKVTLNTAEMVEKKYPPVTGVNRKKPSNR